MMLSKQVRFMLYGLPMAAILIVLLVMGAYWIGETDQELEMTQSSTSTKTPALPAVVREFLYLSNPSAEDAQLKCVSLTYFTSLPAKCLDANGNLIWVGNGARFIYATPSNK